MSSYYVLKIQYVNRPPETRNISAPVTNVGRESGDIVLNDPQTSGRHAELLFQSEQVRVRDVGSTNGTWFNGQRLTEFVLEPGQWFQAGQTTLQLMAVHGEPRPAAAPARTMMASGAPPPVGGMGHSPAPVAPGWSAPGAPPSPAPAGAQPPPAVHASAPSASAQSPYGGGPAPAPAPGYGAHPGQFPGAGGPPQAGPEGYGAPPMGPGAGGFGAMQPVNPGGPMAMGGSMAIRPNFQGSGGSLFVTYLVGALLTTITFGIYGPWFYCKLMNHILSNTTLSPTRRGNLQVEFTGRGGELFVTLLVGGLLTTITFGIYSAWFVTKLIRFFANNVTATAPDGTRYRLGYNGTGGELFVTLLVGQLLTMLTLGIYLPWFICKFRKLLFSRMSVLENDRVAGMMDFEGTGGELFGTYIVGMLLSGLTLGIYASWFNVSLKKFFAEGTRIVYDGRTYTARFHGTGGELFILTLAGTFLSMITVGIYIPWYITKLLKFEYNHLEFSESGMGAPMFPAPGMAQLPPGGMQ